MLFIVSPAKNLDMQRRFNAEASAIRFPEDTQELVGVMRGHGPESVAKLMKLSDKLAHLNHERYLTFNQTTTQVPMRWLLSMATCTKA